MWPTAVLESALVRPATVFTNMAPSATGGNGGDGGGNGGGGEGEGGGGEGGGWACCSSRRWLGMRGVWGGIRMGGGGGIDGRGMGGYGDEDRGRLGPESGGYRDGVGGGNSWECEGGQGGKGRGRGHGVGDTDGKGVSGNEGAVTKLLPGDVLDVLARLVTTPAWACCARR